jgi:hypothetical protein
MDGPLRCITRPTAPNHRAFVCMRVVIYLSVCLSVCLSGSVQTLAAGKALEDRDFKRAMELRGQEMVEAHRTFWELAQAEPRRDAHGSDGATPPPVSTTDTVRRMCVCVCVRMYVCIYVCVYV